MESVLIKIKSLDRVKRIELFKKLWQLFRWELEFASMTDSEGYFYDSGKHRPDRLT